MSTTVGRLPSYLFNVDYPAITARVEARIRGSIRRGVKAMFDDFTYGSELSDIIDDLRTGKMATVSLYRSLDIIINKSTLMYEPVREALDDAGLSVMRIASREVGDAAERWAERSTIPVTADDVMFDADDPLLTSGLRQSGDVFWQSIIDDSITAIRNEVERSYYANENAAKMADNIEMVSGMSSAQGDQFARFRQTVMNGPLTPAQKQAALRTTSDKMKADRADKITRTELHRTSNAGVTSYWDQMARRGRLDLNTAYVRWETHPDERRCPKCAPLDGVSTALHGQFAPGITAPPLHPNCRCSLSIDYLPGQTVTPYETPEDVVKALKDGDGDGKASAYPGGPDIVPVGRKIPKSALKKPTTMKAKKVSVRRGMSIDVVGRADVAQRLTTGKATADDLLSLLPDRAAGVWWGNQKVMTEDDVMVYTSPRYKDDWMRRNQKFDPKQSWFGSIGIIFEGKSTGDPDKFHSKGDKGQAISRLSDDDEVHIETIKYSVDGKTWISVPANVTLKTMHKAFKDGDGDGFYTPPGGRDNVPVPGKLKPRKKMLTLYHGTPDKYVDSIKTDGLKTPGSAITPAKWFMLTDSFDQAKRYANGGSVIEYKIPADQVFRSGSKDFLLWPGHDHNVYGHSAKAYALRSALPSSFISRVIGSEPAVAHGLSQAEISEAMGDGEWDRTEWLDADGKLMDEHPDWRLSPGETKVDYRIRAKEGEVPVRQIVRHTNTREKSNWPGVMDVAGDYVETIGPVEHVYRVVSEADYQRMKKQGFLDTDGRGNISASEGLVTDTDIAWSYLGDISGFKGTDNPTGKGRAIRIKVRPEDGWEADHDGYTKTKKPVPFSQVDMVSQPIGISRTVKGDPNGSHSVSIHWDFSAAPLNVVVPDDPSLYGKPVYATDDVRQPSGAPVRGIPVDPKSLPEKLYHVTTAAFKVKESGRLRALGKGGLGGDEKDQIVSLTATTESAEAILSAMKVLAAAALDSPPESDGDHDIEVGRKMVEAFQKAAKDEGWEWTSNATDHQLEQYSFRDWANQFMWNRESQGGRKNVLLFGVTRDYWMNVNPYTLAVVEVDRADIVKTGALVTDFDFSRGGGLDEFRVYGDVPIARDRVEMRKALRLALAG